MEKNKSMEQERQEQLKKHAVEVFLQYADKGERSGDEVYYATGDFLDVSGDVYSSEPSLRSNSLFSIRFNLVDFRKRVSLP